jgi:hypothetical protein
VKERLLLRLAEFRPFVSQRRGPKSKKPGLLSPIRAPCLEPQSFDYAG